MTAPIIPEEAIRAAVDAIDEGVNWVDGLFGEKYDNAEEVMTDALTAAAPFLTGVRPSSFVNDAGITAADMPHIVVRKLDAAYDARIRSQIETVAPSPRAQALEEEEAEIDKLRFRAFHTNSDADRQAYFDAVSKWFQDRHIRALSSQPVADGWLPIETAPKDRTEILAWRYDSGQFITSFTSCSAFPMSQSEMDELDEDALFKGDWFTQWPQALRLEGSEVPTHWRPLPTPPATRQTGGSDADA